MSQGITLGDFIRLLAVAIPDADRAMPFQDETPWQMLFFRLKNEIYDPKPSFISNLDFDWDGPFPKSQDVSDFLQALHWTGSVAALNPSYEQIIVPLGVRVAWQEEFASMEPQLSALLARSVAIAKEEFPMVTLG